MPSPSTVQRGPLTEFLRPDAHEQPRLHPQASASELHSLSPSVVKLWRTRILLRTLAMLVAAGVFGTVAGLGRLDVLAAFAPVALPAAAIVAAVAGLAGGALAILWPPARYRSWGFAVRQHDVIIRCGVLRRTESIVPHARIQHVDTTHGPLERAFGLASVVLFTAGTVGAALVIPGIPAAEADELRDRLAALGRFGDGV